MSANLNEPPSATNKWPVKILLLGTTGAGKSQFCQAVTELEEPFPAASDTDSLTQEAVTVRFDLPDSWAQAIQRQNPRGPNPSHFQYTIVDTPGIGDTRGEKADEQHLKNITDDLRRRAERVNLIVLAMPLSQPRFNPSVTKTLKIIDAFFNDVHTWDQVCLVVTNVSSDSRQQQLDAFTKSRGEKRCVRDRIIDLVRQLHNWEGSLPELPVFFVNSAFPHKKKSEPEFVRFIQFACTRARTGTDVSHLKELDLRVMRCHQDKREFTVDVRSQKTERVDVTRAAGREKRQVGTKKVKRTRLVKKTIQVPYVVDRDVDAGDFFSFGIARIFRNNRIWRTRDEVRTEAEDYWEDEPVYEWFDNFINDKEYREYTQVDQFLVREERTISWDFDAELPIDYKDNFDRPKHGRSTGPWREVSRTWSKKWDEGRWW